MTLKTEIHPLGIKLTKFQKEALLCSPPYPFDVTKDFLSTGRITEILIEEWKPETWKVASRPRVSGNLLIIYDDTCAKEFAQWLRKMGDLNSGGYKKSFANLAHKIEKPLGIDYWGEKAGKGEAAKEREEMLKAAAKIRVERKSKVGLEVLFDDDACPECGGEPGDCMCEAVDVNRCPKCRAEGMRVGILLWCDRCKDHFEV